MTIISPLPFTLSNGTVADASQVMADLQHIVDETNANAGSSSVPVFSGARVSFSSADQTIPDAVNTQITWEDEQFDTADWFDDSAPNTVLTVPAGVSYVRIDCQLLFLSMSSGKYADVRVYKNGLDIYEVARGFSNGIDALSVRLSSEPIQCTAGDEFEIVVYQNNGSPVACYSLSGQYPRFAIQAVG